MNKNSAGLFLGELCKARCDVARGWPAHHKSRTIEEKCGNTRTTPSRVPICMWMWRAVHLLCAASSRLVARPWLHVSCAFKRRSQRLLTTRQRPLHCNHVVQSPSRQVPAHPRPALKPPAHGGSTGMPFLSANSGHLPSHLKGAHKPACLCFPGTPRRGARKTADHTDF